MCLYAHRVTGDRTNEERKIQSDNLPNYATIYLHVPRLIWSMARLESSHKVTHKERKKERKKCDRNGANSQREFVLIPLQSGHFKNWRATNFYDGRQTKKERMSSVGFASLCSSIFFLSFLCWTFLPRENSRANFWKKGQRKRKKERKKELTDFDTIDSSHEVNPKKPHFPDSFFGEINH